MTAPYDAKTHTLRIPWKLGATSVQYRRAVKAAHSDPVGAPSASNLGAPWGTLPAPGSFIPDDTITYYSSVEGLPNAGIRAGEVIGWRIWHLDDFHLLRSTFVSHSWFPGTIEYAPDLAIYYGPGIHAYKTVEDLMMDWVRESTPVRQAVYGEINMWGEMIEYEHGWKAQFATVRSIIDIMPDDGVLNTRWRYKMHDGGLEVLRSIYGLNGTPLRKPDDRPPYHTRGGFVDAPY